MFFILTSS